ncbi:hypothetical protein JMUB5695_01643 [Mycobacterium heckeshornense]|uniref:Uncharacterized protein n=1 Tax=Mycobacterium heckeshornense TaxID=110505 RepID=A0A7R7YS55_9MYCO|nr:hypothetical protein MHEC_14830 [Mycobacterium heckeshornense]BCQ08218.1 hypothetical protein JMUB5695_01643 [Mycobacterium heckeshornense]
MGAAERDCLGLIGAVGASTRLTVAASIESVD